MHPHGLISWLSDIIWLLDLLDWIGI